MNIQLLRLAVAGLFTVGTSISTLAIEAFAPSEFIGSKQALAQDVDEQINIKVYERASPAVVSIDSQDGNGSGSIISSDGLVLTNAHVLANAGSTVKVTLADGRQVTGDVLAFANDGLDLAMVKIRGESNLPMIPIASSGSVKVGQRAFAIGNPFGRFQGTLTVGIVSRIDTQRGLIQTDAAINPGNSGGPLLNSQGELIGVNTAIFTGSAQRGNIGIGFAISVDRVQPFLTAVREGRASRTASRQPQLREDAKPQKITLNGPPINGQLGPGSLVLRADNSFFNVYTFEGAAGQQVTIEMDSQDFDPFLILLSPRGRDLAQDDDGGGDKNARIVATLPANGTYTLIANSAQGGESGTYRLQIASTEGGSRSASVSEVAVPPVTQTRFMARLAGILGPGSSVLPSDGSLFRETRFPGRAGQPVNITLESPDFDTYLVIITPEGDVLAQNDNANPNTKNSEIRTTLPRDGIYRVIVNARDRQGTGRYVLTIQ